MQVITASRLMDNLYILFCLSWVEESDVAPPPPGGLLTHSRTGGTLPHQSVCQGRVAVLFHSVIHQMQGFNVRVGLILAECLSTIRRMILMVYNTTLRSRTSYFRTMLLLLCRAQVLDLVNGG